MSNVYECIEDLKKTEYKMMELLKKISDFPVELFDSWEEDLVNIADEWFCEQCSRYVSPLKNGRPIQSVQDFIQAYDLIHRGYILHTEELSFIEQNIVFQLLFGMGADDEHPLVRIKEFMDTYEGRLEEFGFEPKADEDEDNAHGNESAVYRDLDFQLVDDLDDWFFDQLLLYESPIKKFDDYDFIDTTLGFIQAIEYMRYGKIVHTEDMSFIEYNKLFIELFSTEEYPRMTIRLFQKVYDRRMFELGFEMRQFPEEEIDHKNEYDDELSKLIGLDSIKKDVDELVNMVKVQKYRQEKGLKPVPMSLHLVFSGNPGTGKTTVARILAQIYKEIGILEKGQLVETDRAGLVGGYLGQTAIKTQEKINEALGGILFIDEAYTLNRRDDDFGQEAIDTLLKAMEDHRDELIVIVAGYTDLMENFINSNPGLKSRFSKTFVFPDYSYDELCQIFTKMCREFDYRLSDDAKEKAFSVLKDMVNNKPENFANARDVRNMFERVIRKQASRVVEIESCGNDELKTIQLSDVK